jgi:hypothetical protein
MVSAQPDAIVYNAISFEQWKADRFLFVRHMFSERRSQCRHLLEPFGE